MKQGKLGGTSWHQRRVIYCFEGRTWNIHNRIFCIDRCGSVHFHISHCGIFSLLLEGGLQFARANATCCDTCKNAFLSYEFIWTHTESFYKGYGVHGQHVASHFYRLHRCEYKSHRPFFLRFIDLFVFRRFCSASARFWLFWPSSANGFWYHLFACVSVSMRFGRCMWNQHEVWSDSMR